MKITYRREMKHNYLIIDPDETGYDGFEMHMMAANGIEGLMKFHINQVDNHKSYYYEITSKQPLNRLLEYQSLGEGELKKLIGGIAQTLGRLEVFLLNENQIILEPEYIYVEPERFQVYLCLVPGRKGSFPEEMTGLLRYLLGKVNHQDKECVVMAYGLYQESLKENYGVNDLLKIIGRKSTDTQGEDRKETDQMKERTQEEDSSSLFLNSFKEDNRNNADSSDNSNSGNADFPVVTAAIVLLLSIVGIAAALWLVLGLNGLYKYWYAPLAAGILAGAAVFFINNKKGQQPGSEFFKRQEMQSLSEERYDWQMVFDEGKEIEETKEHRQFKEHKEVKENKENIEYNKNIEYKINTELNKDIDQNKNKNTRHNKDTPRPESEPDYMQTVLLTDTSIDKEIRYLRAVGSEIPDASITYVPYLIGKQEGLVDYVIESETISRIHARIDRVEDEYQLSDLNSTNGISVNGRILETNETVVLKKGDEIFIANFAFIFT